MRRLTSLLAMALVLSLGLPGPALAQGGGQRIATVRDAEIEETIRVYATPLLQAAGISPSSLQVVLINDTSLNAFVTAGARLFLHTGTLMESDDPTRVIGVIAHEIGHMQGGHVARRGGDTENLGAAVWVGYLLGLGAALASGRPEAGVAIGRAGQDLAVRNLLAYSRNQEQSADQAAVTLLEANQMSPRGLLGFLDKLEGQEVFLASPERQPYLSTHPLTRERITFMERAVAESPYSDYPPAQELVERQARMRAKLIGFLLPEQRVLREYPLSDNSIPARYARSIASYRSLDVDKALSTVDTLIADEPNNPYFHELKGQILYENGRLKEALPAYQRSVDLRPEEPQLRLALARVQIGLEGEAMDRAALENLRIALSREPDNAFAWRQAAIAYGRLGDEGMTALALGESAFLRGELEEAVGFSKRAQSLIAPNTPGWLRAGDVERAATQALKRRR